MPLHLPTFSFSFPTRPRPVCLGAVFLLVPHHIGDGCQIPCGRIYSFPTLRPPGWALAWQTLCPNATVSPSTCKPVEAHGCLYPLLSLSLPLSYCLLWFGRIRGPAQWRIQRQDTNDALGPRPNSTGKGRLRPPLPPYTPLTPPSPTKPITPLLLLCAGGRCHVSQHTNAPSSGDCAVASSDILFFFLHKQCRATATQERGLTRLFQMPRSLASGRALPVACHHHQDLVTAVRHPGAGQRPTRPRWAPTTCRRPGP